MRFEDYQTILQYGENPWLDYKAQLDHGIEHPRTGKEALGLREIGRAILLKDLVCLANSPCPQEVRFLVRGVLDDKSGRKEVGVELSLSDADVQGWAESKFDPPLEFTYHQWLRADGRFVGVFEIRRSRRGPHVALQDLGATIFKGQVWTRSGTRNQVALRPELLQLFTPHPQPLLNWSFGDGSTGSHMTFAGLLEQRNAFERAFPERIRQAVAKLKQAASLTDVQAQPVKRAKDEAAYAFKANPEKVQELQENLEEWGIKVPAALLQPRDVLLNKEASWPSRYQFDLHVIGGAGVQWYKELENLLGLLSSYSSEHYWFTGRALTFNSNVQVVNAGKAPLFSGRVKMRAHGAQFHDLQPGLATKITAGLIRQKGFSEWSQSLGTLAPNASTHFTVRLDRPSWAPVAVDYEVEDQLGVIWGQGRLWIDQELGEQRKH